ERPESSRSPPSLPIGSRSRSGPRTICSRSRRSIRSRADRAMSSGPDIGRLRRVPRTELVRMLAEQPVAEPWRLVRELRETAVRYYSTDAAEARAIAARAVELAELMRDDRSRGWAYRALAEALAFSGRLRESEEAYQKATTALRR